jgi:regulator of protease activity HflC (stomatin/prohibitin superfamily)
LLSVLGQAELDEVLSKRDKINLRLQEIIDRQTDPWGIKVTAIKVRDAILPDSMKRAMARQVESERERRAKIINPVAEFQAAQKLVLAASMISAQPIALQLRFLTDNEGGRRLPLPEFNLARASRPQFESHTNHKRPHSHPSFCGS